jgi:hypothetical protein
MWLAENVVPRLLAGTVVVPRSAAALDSEAVQLLAVAPTLAVAAAHEAAVADVANAG